MTYLRWLWRGPVLAASVAMILCVRAYQKLIRPVLPPMCRFHPGCSEYFILSVKKHGPLYGCVKGAWRICRCNPWNRGGYDPP
jgi:putative membrane protein insertion efficiency factor